MFDVSKNSGLLYSFEVLSRGTWILNLCISLTWNNLQGWDVTPKWQITGYLRVLPAKWNSYRIQQVVILVRYILISSYSQYVFNEHNFLKAMIESSKALKPSPSEWFEGNENFTFAFSTNYLYLDGARESWHPFSWKTKPDNSTYSISCC